MKISRMFAVIAVVILMPFTVNAVEVQFAGGFGLLLQDGKSSELAFSVDGTTPWWTIDGNRHTMSAEATFTYADREIYLARAYPVYYQRPLATIGGIPLNIGMGIGGYTEIVSGGTDLQGEAMIMTLGVQTWKVDVTIGGEVLKYDGPDLYCVGLELKLML